MGLFDIFRSQPSAEQKQRRQILPNMRAGLRMMFGSADVGRLTGDWPTMPAPADWIVAKHQRTLVARSREQAHNNDFMRAYLRLVRQNIVGSSGIALQSRAMLSSGKPDKKSARAIERWFKDWGKRDNCDVAGKLSWRAMLSAAAESAARDGEVMLRIITGPDAGKYGYALQVLDAQRCPVDLDEDARPDGSFVRHGIRFNKYGRPLEYGFNEQDPNSSRQGYTYAGRSVKWIPAAEIIHAFVAELPGQKRGLPWLSTGLFRMKQMGAFEDAAIVNARVSAAKMGFIEYAEGHGPEASDEELSIDAEAGSFVELPEGAKLNKFDPSYPAGEFAVVMKQLLRSLAAGGGVAYHTLAQDLEGVNFSSIRQGTLDEREFYMDRQEWIIEEIASRVFVGALERSLLAGAIKSENGRALSALKVDLLSDHAFQGRRWSWIDPRADADAASTSTKSLMKSLSKIIREGGDDPETVFDEIAADIAAMKEAGIPDNVIEAAFGLKPVPPKPDAPPPKET